MAAPKSEPRSWLIEGQQRPGNVSDGQVVASGDLYLATGLDPVFLLLPALAGQSVARSSEGQKQLFLSSDDYFDKLPEESSHLAEIVRWEKTRSLLEARMAAICDTVEAGDETMFRLSQKKLVSVCLQKARNLSNGNSLPPSLEKQFVTHALQAPMVPQKRAAVATESQKSEESVESGKSTPLTDTNDSQSTTATTETAATSVDGDNEEIEQAMKPSQEIIDLQRLRVALQLICERLITPEVSQWLKQGLTDEKLCDVNFTPLDDYLAKLAALRAEALAMRSMGDYSRKHGRDEEDDEAREEKRRKLEEEKRKKASESRGVRDLKKVNTTGMKKLSHFFQKK